MPKSVTRREDEFLGKVTHGAEHRNLEWEPQSPGWLVPGRGFMNLKKKKEEEEEDKSCSEKPGHQKAPRTKKD